MEDIGEIRIGTQIGTLLDDAEPGPLSQLMDLIPNGSARAAAGLLLLQWNAVQGKGGYMGLAPVGLFLRHGEEPHRAIDRKVNSFARQRLQRTRHSCLSGLSLC